MLSLSKDGRYPALELTPQQRRQGTRRHPSVDIVISVHHLVDAWLSRSRTTDVDQVVKHAREMDHAASLIYALAVTSVPRLLIGNYASVNAQTDEAIAMAEEIAEVFWKVMGATVQGYVLVLTGKASEAVHHHFRDRCIPINGSNSLVAERVIISGEGLCGPWPV